jgi:outer membrane lipoprotein SlyB
VLPLVALLCVLAAAVSLVVVHVGLVADERARAGTAADAAALAGAAAGRGEADALARENGALLERFERDGAETVVVVRIGRATAEARARREPAGAPLGSDPAPGPLRHTTGHPIP